MKWVKGIAFVLALLFAIAISLYGYLFGGWFTPKTSVSDHLAVVEPSFDVGIPSTGAAPFPVALLVPGCIGTHSHHHAWAETLQNEGWATIIIDSFTPRGITKFEDLEKVCEGARPWGFERAADIVAAAEYAAREDNLNQNSMALLGWSNGAWAAMDALSFGEDSRPTNLTALPDDWAANIRSVFLFYPYCGFGTRSASYGWHSRPNAIMFLASKDENVSPIECVAAGDALRNSGVDIRTVEFPNATHWFDNPQDFDLLPHEFNPSATREAQLLVRKSLAESLDKKTVAISSPEPAGHRPDEGTHNPES